MTAFLIAWLLGAALGYRLLIACALREFGKVTLGDAVVLGVSALCGGPLPGVVYWCILHTGKDGKEIVLWRRK